MVQPKKSYVSRELDFETKRQNSRGGGAVAQEFVATSGYCQQKTPKNAYPKGHSEVLFVVPGLGAGEVPRRTLPALRFNFGTAAGAMLDRRSRIPSSTSAPQMIPFSRLFRGVIIGARVSPGVVYGTSSRRVPCVSRPSVVLREFCVWTKQRTGFSRVRARYAATADSNSRCSHCR